MSDVLDKAIEKLRSLSARQRKAAAAMIEDFVAESDQVYVLTDDERALVEEGLAELDRGQYATDSEVEAVFARFRAR